MGEDLDRVLIGKAIAEYAAGDYGRIADELAVGSFDSSRVVLYNTLFYRPPLKVDSWDYFRSLRKASGQNLYLHVPFCRTSCLYCTYEKVLTPSAETVGRYLQAIRHEIERKTSILKSQLDPDIYYIGGGTPTHLSETALRSLFQLLTSRFDLRKRREMTVETTPGAVLAEDGEDKFRFLKNAGVDRINVGVQSFCSEVAQKNGRRQSSEEIFRSFAILRRIGFEKVNLDLIYGLVGQTPAHWAKDLEAAVRLDPDSITTFSLRVRPPSRLFTLVRNGKISPPSESDLITMRIMAQHWLSSRGYQEDVPDYFIRSTEKRFLYQPFQPHNHSRNLIGLGPSAYSLAGDRQIFNLRDTEAFLRRSESGTDPVDSAIYLDREEYARKSLAVGLRSVFDDAMFAQECGFSVREGLPEILEKLNGLHLIEAKGARICLSPAGRILHNRVAEYIMYSPIDTRSTEG